MKNRLLKISIPIIFLLIVWYIIAFIVDNPILVPYFHQVIVALFHLLIVKTTYVAIMNTFLNIIIGVLLSFAVAFLLFVIGLFVPWISEYISPIISIIKTVPAAAVTIILIILLGSFLAPIVITFLVVFPIMYEGMLLGLHSISKDQKEAIALFSGTNLYSLKTVYLPLMLPYIKNIFIQSFGLGIKVMVMAELLTQSSSSIGKQIYIEKINLNTDYLFAWVIILVSIALIFDTFLNKNKETY